MTDRHMQVFFEVHKDLPREGPGSKDSTRKAYRLLADKFRSPRILDIGCGPGAQTLDLAEVSGGRIVAIDNHQGFLDQLVQRIAASACKERISLQLADMMNLPFADESFDLIWAEGSIFVIGVEKGLKEWRRLLRKRGVVAFTEVCWLKEDRPKELVEFWDDVYPAIGSIERNLEKLEGAGYGPIGSFTLPDSDWWDEYYGPIEGKLEGLKEKYKDDAEALEVLAMEDHEIAMFRRYSSFYGYVFYMGEKRD